MNEAFPRTWRESDEGDILPSYEAGNGNQPIYENPSSGSYNKEQSCECVLDCRSDHHEADDNGSKVETDLTSNRRREGEGSRGSFPDDDGGEFKFGPGNYDKATQRRIIQMLRRSLHGPLDEEVEGGSADNDFNEEDL